MQSEGKTITLMWINKNKVGCRVSAALWRSQSAPSSSVCRSVGHTVCHRPVQSQTPAVSPPSACRHHTSMVLLFWLHRIIWWLLQKGCYLFRHGWVMTSTAWQQAGLERRKSLPSAGARVTWAPSCGVFCALLLLFGFIFGFHRRQCGFVYHFHLRYLHVSVKLNTFLYPPTPSFFVFLILPLSFAPHLSLLPVRGVSWRSPGNPCRLLYQRQDWRSSWPRPQI